MIRKIDRTTNGHGEVESMTFAEIERLRLLGPDGKPTAYRVPTLKSVLRIARDKIVVDLHLKVDRAPEVAAILRQAGIRHALSMPTMRRGLIICRRNGVAAKQCGWPSLAKNWIII